MLKFSFPEWLPAGNAVHRFIQLSDAMHLVLWRLRRFAVYLQTADVDYDRLGAEFVDVTPYFVPLADRRSEVTANRLADDAVAFAGAPVEPMMRELESWYARAGSTFVDPGGWDELARINSEYSSVPDPGSSNEDSKGVRGRVFAGLARLGGRFPPEVYGRLEHVTEDSFIRAGALVSPRIWQLIRDARTAAVDPTDGRIRYTAADLRSLAGTCGEAAASYSHPVPEGSRWWLCDEPDEEDQARVERMREAALRIRLSRGGPMPPGTRSFREPPRRLPTRLELADELTALASYFERLAARGAEGGDGSETEPGKSPETTRPGSDARLEREAASSVSDRVVASLKVDPAKFPQPDTAADEGPFEPFGVRIGGYECNFSGAPLRHRLMVALWDETRKRWRPRPEAEVLEAVYPGEEEAESKLKDLASKTGDALRRAGIAATVRRAGGKVWLDRSYDARSP